MLVPRTLLDADHADFRLDDFGIPGHWPRDVWLAIRAYDLIQKYQDSVIRGAWSPRGGIRRPEAEQLHELMLGPSGGNPSRVFTPGYPHPSTRLEDFIRWLGKTQTPWEVGFDVDFVVCDSQESRRFHMGGYVSWLRITSMPGTTESGKLQILLNYEKILQNLVPNDSEFVHPVFDFKKFFESKEANLFREFRSKLCRILVHEGAHIVLHLDRLIAEAVHMPESSPKEEQEAWVFSKTWWSEIVSSVAQASRERGQTDTAWLS